MPIPAPAALPVLGYCRVSTDRQAGEKVTSLGDQAKAIDAKATALGGAVVEWFRDEGASGATVERRPAFLALLGYCRANPRRSGDRGVVLALNDSRWGRFPNPDEAAHWRFTLEQLGWHVQFCESDEIADPTFRTVVRALGSAQASEYRRNIQRNARRGTRGAAEQGFWTREAPIGYRRRVVYPLGRERTLDIGVRKADDEKVALTPGPDAEVSLVRWMFDAYGRGTHTLGMLCGDLLERWPARPWTRGTVYAILRNVAYVGDVLGGRRPADREERQRTPQRAAAEWYGKPDAHPALIPRALFDQVQARLAENAGKYRGRAARAVYAFGGLVRCARCGEPFVGGGGLSKKIDPRRRYRFYKDRGGHVRGSACFGAYGVIGKHILDAAIVETITAELQKPAARRAMARALDNAIAAAEASGEVAGSESGRQRAALTRRRDNLLAAIADGTITNPEAAPQLAKIRADLDMLESRGQASRFASRGARTLREERERLLTLAADFPALAARVSGPALRELVRPWLDSAVFDKASRQLTLGIRRLPEVHALASVAPAGPRVIPAKHSGRVRVGCASLGSVRFCERRRRRSTA